MKVILEDDIIRKMSPNGVEVGNLLKGVPIERMRFDGEKLVDLNDLSEIWVKNRNGVFEFHVLEVPGAQLVACNFRDKKNLFSENGKIKVKEN